MSAHVLWLHQLRLTDLAQVGGKNSSLGEMIGNLSGLGVSVPGGFATTADAFKEFVAHNDLSKRIFDRLATLDVENVDALVAAGKQIRGWVIDAPLQPVLEQAIREAYAQLCKEAGAADVAVAVRSSATAEDLPDASFAGQQETFLNVVGIDDVLRRIREVFASLYNDRAIAYRVHHGFKHEDVFLSAGVQLMVRSDIGASGVLFTLDTESGFRDVVFVTSSYGLGENVVQGAVNPDEFYAYKPNLRAGRPSILRRTLGSKQIRMVYSDAPGERVRNEPTPVELQSRFSISDADVEELSRQSLTIEEHYGRPMDIEWAKDGNTGKLYIVQARPETVKSRTHVNQIERYHLGERGQVVAEGRSIGHRIGAGTARVVRTLAEMSSFQAGDVLVADMTDPDWEPIMKRAAAIVTNRGGRTCHAAIIARELGVPAVVGCGDATDLIPDGTEVTVSCSEGDTGFIYKGLLPFERIVTDLEKMPPAPLKIMMNVGNPERAFDFSQLPHQGIGLARLEFIIARQIGVHPRALLEYDRLNAETKRQIEPLMAGYASPVDFYVDRLAEGIATLTAAFAPYPVIVRLSDFKSNEYANLIGGSQYEPHEENPMIGFRGASRYVDPSFAECFALECRAVKKVRDEMGLTNCWVMIPFVRTVDEGKQVIEVLARNGLVRGENELKVVMMCEVPSNALLADEFLELFDGFSIGSNDLTQLCLGLDRDSAVVAHLFDERNPAVKKLLSMAISAARAKGKYIGICGQGPSDHPDLADWLMEQGIESVSLNPDTVVDTWLRLAKIKASEAMNWFVQAVERGFDVALAHEWLWRIALALVLLVVGLWLVRRLTRVLDRLMLRFQVEDILRSFLRNVAYAIGLVVVFIAALDFLGVPTTSLLAVVGAAGLAIGLALKDSLANIASGVMLIVLRPFHIGDQVQIAGLEGVVESVRIFQTKMVTADNREIILPNSQITTAAIINYSGRGERRIDLVLPMAFGDELEAVRKALLALASQNARVKASPKPEVLVTALGESTVSVQLRAWVAARDHAQVQAELLEAALGDLARRRLQSPLGKREVHVHHHGAPAALPPGLDDALKPSL